MLSSRIATPTASRILAVRMIAKSAGQEVAVGNFAQICEQKVSSARLPKPCFVFAFLLKDLGPVSMDVEPDHRAHRQPKPCRRQDHDDDGGVDSVNRALYLGDIIAVRIIGHRNDPSTDYYFELTMFSGGFKSSLKLHCSKIQHKKRNKLLTGWAFCPLRTRLNFRCITLSGIAAFTIPGR